MTLFTLWRKTLKIKYVETPKEVAELVTPILKKYQRIVKDQVDTFEIRFSSSSELNGEAFYAATSIRTEYRFASIYIAPEWLQLSQEDREEVLVHELCHIFTTQLRTEVQRILSHFFEESLAAYAEDVFAGADEAVVAALAKVFVDIYSQKS